MLKRTLFAAAALALLASPASAACTYWVAVYESAVVEQKIKTNDALMGNITKARGLANDGKENECMVMIKEIDLMLEKSGETKMVSDWVAEMGKQGRPVAQ